MDVQADLSLCWLLMQSQRKCCALVQYAFTIYCISYIFSFSQDGFADFSSFKSSQAPASSSSSSDLFDMFSSNTNNMQSNVPIQPMNQGLMGSQPMNMTAPGLNIMSGAAPGNMSGTNMMGQPMMSQQPGMMTSQPGMMASQPGMSSPGMTSQPGMMASQPGTMASQPGMMGMQQPVSFHLNFLREESA